MPNAYDPQPFHLSDDAAAETHFGRLSASGWHTCAMTMAMLVENLKKHRQAGLGSPGLDELRWLTPRLSRRHAALRERGAGQAPLGQPAGNGHLQESVDGFQSGRRGGDDDGLERADPDPRPPRRLSAAQPGITPPRRADYLPRCPPPWPPPPPIWPPPPRNACPAGREPPPPVPRVNPPQLAPPLNDWPRPPAKARCWPPQ